MLGGRGLINIWGNEKLLCLYFWLNCIIFVIILFYCSFYCFFLFVDKLKFLELDFVFVISVIVLKVGDNFKKIKDIIKDIVGKYGINKMYYSLGIFGSKLNVIIKFSW